MAMRALKKERTTANWITIMNDKLYKPAGLTTAPEYSSAFHDVPLLE